MKALLVPTVVILALSGVVAREGSLRGRLEELEERPVVNPADLRAVPVLEAEVAELTRTLEEARERLSISERRRGEAERQRDEIDWRLQCLEDALGATGREVASYTARLEDWEDQWDGHGPNLFEERIGELRAALEERWLELDHLAASAAELAREDRERIEQLDRSLVSLTERDMPGMWRGLVGPVVQISGDSTVGSGVLLESTPITGSDSWKTNLLTSWHVVRDIYQAPDQLDEPIEIKIYREDGSTLLEPATLLAYDAELDVALLELDTAEPVACGARLPSRERLGAVQVFDQVYAVGCPLGNDPIPTAGEIASTHHRVDGADYWMISAPTYIGNSGGGIFDAETHELLGIFSKIYTHGNLRSTIVPHMGLVTPLPTIYDWFESVGYLELAQRAETEGGAGPAEAAVSTASR